METRHYNLFKTRWGWFGLLGNEKGLLRICLPVAHKGVVVRRMLPDAPNAKHSKTAFSVLEKRIKAYYDGNPDDFRDIEVHLGGFTEFQRKTLAALRQITYGKTISYRGLAELTGNPKAARAIGAVMAKNPTPLVIPCHRVIKADGTLGRFSAPGGAAAKKRMLELEKQE